MRLGSIKVRGENIGRKEVEKDNFYSAISTSICQAELSLCSSLVLHVWLGLFLSTQNIICNWLKRQCHEIDFASFNDIAEFCAHSNIFANSSMQKYFNV